MNKIAKLEILPENINTIFWIRHESFQSRNDSFYKLNQLLDGVLERVYTQIQASDSDEQWLQNVYLTGQNFDSQLHFFCINATQFRLKTELENIRSILKPKFSQEESIDVLIIDETETFREEYFKISSPATNFFYLN